MGMKDISPRLWTYSPANSPIPLPDRPLLFTPETVISLSSFSSNCSHDETLDRKGVETYVAGFGNESTSLSDLLLAHDAPPLAERKAVLLLGELANPYRLQDMGMGVLPLIPVRLEGLCRTWADALDPRESYPGVHHVTLARTPGWWELAYIGMASKDQLMLIKEWLENGIRGSWRPVKLGEGNLRFEHDMALQPPHEGDVQWDGTEEHVSIPIPEATGPSLDLNDIMVLVHARQGCYNHRGRLARCAHINQRSFHENLFRKGSSHRWDAILTLR